MFMYPEVLLYICIHSRSHVDAATAPVTYFGDRRDRCPYLRGYSSMALNSSYSILPELSCRGNARDVKAVVAVLVVVAIGIIIVVVVVVVHVRDFQSKVYSHNSLVPHVGLLSRSSR